MNTPEKINLAKAILDELATIGYLDNHRHKCQSLQLIRELLNDFDPAPNPTRADNSLNSAKLLANIDPVTTYAMHRQLQGLAELAEKTIGELHVNTAFGIINN